MRYTKLDKEDPEEIIHRRAQFLIYKSLKKADSMRKPSLTRVRLCRLKIKIGKKLKKLKRSVVLVVSAARVRVCKQVSCQLKRLFSTSPEAVPAFPVVFA